MSQISFNLFCSGDKRLYQSFLGNEVDFRDIMNVSLIPWLKIEISENWDSFVDERALIATVLISSCHRKSLVPFSLRKKRPVNVFLTLVVNYRKIVQKNMPSKTAINRIFNDICYLFIACFDRKIGVFQQAIVRVFNILKKNKTPPTSKVKQKQK